MRLFRCLGLLAAVLVSACVRIGFRPASGAGGSSEGGPKDLTTLTEPAAKDARRGETAAFEASTDSGGGSGTHAWSRRFGDTGADLGLAVAVDGSGNVAVTGQFWGTVDFGGGPFASGGHNDIFVASYGPTGAHRWSKRFGDPTYDDAGCGVAVDGSGNVIVTGYAEGAVDFGGGIHYAGYHDVFVASFGPAGAYRWQKFFDSENGFSVTVDGSGNVTVTGQFWGTVDFGGGPLTSPNNVDDIFLVSLGPTGAHRWSQRFGSAAFNEMGMGVAVDGSGNVTLTGTFQTTVDFGGGPLAAAGGNDIFVASYGPTGTHRWSKRFGGTSDDEGHGVAVDKGGNVTVVGTFQGTADFGGGPLAAVGGRDIFVAKYGPTGAHLWSKRFGGTSNDSGHSVAVDGSGNVTVTGTFQTSVDFGGGPLASAGGRDIFVASYGPTGTHRWSKRFGGTSDDEGRGVAVDASGKVIVTGGFSGTVDFGGGPLASAGLSDIFLVAFSN